MYTYKMFDVGSVRELLGLPNPSAAKIPASLAKPERNPLIGDRWGYELANREIGRQATAVGVGTGGSNPASSSMRPRTFGLPHRARRCRNSLALAGWTDGSNPLSSSAESGTNRRRRVRGRRTQNGSAARG